MSIYVMTWKGPFKTRKSQQVSFYIVESNNTTSEMTTISLGQPLTEVVLEAGISKLTVSGKPGQSLTTHLMRIAYF